MRTASEATELTKDEHESVEGGYMSCLMRYATSYISLLENNAISAVVEAENIVDAMIKAILLQTKNDEYFHDTQDWLNSLKDYSVEGFKSEVLGAEMSVDAVLIDVG
jgi:hypothetical protein